MTYRSRPGPADLLVRNAALVATCDAAGRELPGGWVAVTDGLVSAVGASGDANLANNLFHLGGLHVTGQNVASAEEDIAIPARPR